MVTWRHTSPLYTVSPHVPLLVITSFSRFEDKHEQEFLKTLARVFPSNTYHLEQIILTTFKMQ